MTTYLTSIGELGTLLRKKNFEKSQNAEKTEREDPLVSSGIVCYAGNLFGSVPWTTRYILASSVNFVELLVELFWSVHVYFGLKKTLTKSHDYSRLLRKAPTKNCEQNLYLNPKLSN